MEVLCLLFPWRHSVGVGHAAITILHRPLHRGGVAARADTSNSALFHAPTMHSGWPWINGTVEPGDQACACGASGQPAFLRGSGAAMVDEVDGDEN